MNFQRSRNSKKSKKALLSTFKDSLSQVKNFPFTVELRARSSLKKDYAYWRDILDSIPLMVWTTHANGEVEYFNSEWYKYTAVNKQSSLKNKGAALQSIIHPRDISVAAQKWLQAVKAGEEFSFECRLRTKKKNYKWFLAKSIPIKGKNENITRWFGICTDIDEHKKNDVILRRQSKVLEEHAKLLDLTNDAVMVRELNTDKLIFWNKGAERIYGYTKKEAIGKVGHKLLRAKLPKSISELQKVVLKNGKWYGEIVQYAKDGKKIFIASEWVANKGENGTTTIFTRNTNITRQKEVEARKDQFITTASHELKTPLSAIVAFCQILERYVSVHKDKKIIYFVSKLGIQVNKLTKLVNELLDVSRIQSGRLDFREDLFDYDELVREIVIDFQHTDVDHNIVRVGNAQEKIYGDRDRLSQVLINLIANAIKFSPAGSKIIVTTSLKRGRIITSVQDFGIGIKKEEQKMIFDSFYRVKGGQGVSTSGLGMGLHIASEIIKRHNGKIWVVSDYKKGSTFYFSIPIRRQTKAA